ncbi:reverse transcriptase [Ancylostoma duodenale]|uniref:Reverse transcriptase n=1 Tax=Ancylostoma duodenale TaxID=51022 RepID=A0A0C2D8E0_9BILA|nr:reverse transcriptase [Ancylostoma duodenale]
MSYYMKMMVAEVKADQNSDVAMKLRKSYPEIFEEGLGLCTKEKADLQLVGDVRPVFKACRPVPHAAVEAVEKELGRLLEMNVITPVTHSEWAAPIVCVRKSNGKLRMCADFLTGLNKALESFDYPLSVPEDIFATLNGGAVFSQIDLSDAYLQIELSDKSKKTVVINTHKRLFQYNRSPFGIKAAPGIFQQIMNKMVAGLRGVATYLDDILVFGRTEQEHMENLLALFERIAEYGFKMLKKALSSELNLAHYDPKQKIVVTADACDYGIGCVISHRYADGLEKPIAHASRSLTAAEKNYSQIEKEALGIVFAVKEFHKYVFGRNFLLLTDHKSLLAIFGNKKGVPMYSANRLMKWATILLGYDFDIEYVNTTKFGQTDGLSRLMRKHQVENEDIVIAAVENDVCTLLKECIRRLPVTVTDVESCTKSDPLLRKAYRTTPNSSLNEKTPAEVFLGRKLRTRLSLLVPQPDDIEDPLAKARRERMEQQFARKHGVVKRKFEVGDKVFAREWKAPQFHWVKGTMVRRLGSVNYEVELDGRIVHKHANQLRFRDGGGHKGGSDTLKVLLEVLAAEDIYKRQGNKDEPNPDRVLPNARVPAVSSPTSTTTSTQQLPPPPLRRSSRIRRPVQRLDPSPLWSVRGWAVMTPEQVRAMSAKADEERRRIKSNIMQQPQNASVAQTNAPVSQHQAAAAGQKGWPFIFV